MLPGWTSGQRRVWSAASSSGEEAYSLAMLLDAERPGAEWEITGTDISDRMIEWARRGRYPIARAERIPRAYLHRYCLKGTGSSQGELLIDRTLRRQVMFQRGNLMLPQSALGEFDLILLRNVMIYFETQTKQQVLQNVLRQLKPGGHLLIGHSESINGMTDELVPVQPAIYRKTGGVQR